MRRFLCITALLPFLYTNGYAQNSTSTIGDSIQLALPLYAGIHSLALKDNKGFKQIANAALASTLVCHGLKHLINEKRPNGGNHSFPSGHTQISFTASTYLWKRYGPEYGIPATVLATFVGYSRVQGNHHFVHDCVAGAAFGAIVGYVFTTKYSKYIQLSPNGISFQFAF